MGNKLNPNIVKNGRNPTTINVEKPRPEELQDTTTPKATSGLSNESATATLKMMIDLVIKSRLLLDHNILQRIVQLLMLYPPKKRAYSPEAKQTKDLSNLMNINSKFTGSGGSS
jgi:hypothetical protein